MRMTEGPRPAFCPPRGAHGGLAAAIGLRLVGTFDAIASPGFGAVQCFVRIFEQRAQCMLGIHADRHAAADRRSDLTVTDKPAVFGESDADSLSTNVGRFDARSRQHDSEF